MFTICRASDFFQDWWAEVTHGAKNGGSFSEMMGPKHIKLTTPDILVVDFTYTVHTDTDTCMHICILTADCTVRPVLSGYSRKKTNYHLMQVKSIAECSKGSILQSF